MKQIIEDAWLLALGNANAVLLRDVDDLVLFGSIAARAFDTKPI